MKYYRPNSVPLEELCLDNISALDCVYDELGKYVQKIYHKDEVYFVDLLDSVLNEGEIMSDLTELQLELFWALSKTKLNRYYETKDTGKRR